MIHATLDRFIRILDLTPRDVRLAVERRLSPTLAAHHDAWMRRDEESCQALALTHAARDAAERESAERQASVNRMADLLADREVQLTWCRAEIQRWADTALARLRDAEEAQRERDDLRAAIAGALRELDASEMFAPGLIAQDHLTAAKGLLRATLGAPTAEQAHDVGPLSRRGADLPAPAEPIPSTSWRVGDVVTDDTPDGWPTWGPLRLTGADDDHVYAVRLRDDTPVKIGPPSAVDRYRRATDAEIAAALAKREAR